MDNFDLTPQKSAKNPLIWNLLTGGMLAASLGMLILILTIFANPYVSYNPFPPPSLPTVYVTNTPTITPIPPPATWTASPTIPPSPINTLAPTWTPEPTRTPFVIHSPTP